MTAKIEWAPGTHERRVESFYSRGAESFGECHGGYLNFGLWDEGVRDYVAAAENLVRTLAQWGRIGPESHILDVGCGFGSQDVFLARNFHPARIVGVDVTFPHVIAARERAQRAGLGLELQFQHGSATDLGFPTGSFTHVLGVEGVVHFKTRERFLREARRVLRPGGTLLIADYCLARAPRGAADALFVALARAGWQIPRENVETVDSYRERLVSCGYREVEIVRAGARTIPGYFHEAMTREHLRSMRKIRGMLGLLGSVAIDLALWAAWSRGQLEYLLVKCVRSCE